MLDVDKAAARWAVKDLESLTEARLLCRAFRCVVQAGGLHGLFAQELARYFGVVHTFEPDSRLFGTMAQALAGTLNVRMYQAALGFERQQVSTVHARRDRNPNRPIHAGVTHCVPGGTIATLRIDDLGLRDCDLIVLDIEGDEGPALVGAGVTIGLCRPVIMIESASASAGTDWPTARVKEWLTGQGYDFAKRSRSNDIYVPRA